MAISIIEQAFKNNDTKLYIFNALLKMEIFILKAFNWLLSN